MSAAWSAVAIALLSLLVTASIQLYLVVLDRRRWRESHSVLLFVKSYDLVANRITLVISNRTDRAIVVNGISIDLGHRDEDISDLAVPLTQPENRFPRMIASGKFTRWAIAADEFQQRVVERFDPDETALGIGLRAQLNFREEVVSEVSVHLDGRIVPR